MKTSQYRAGHASLRKGRISISGQIYFITVCCVRQENLLAIHEAARAAARTLHKMHVDKYIHLRAWVLMPDHIHLLIELTETQTLSEAIGRINSCVAKAINKALNRSGTVWQGAYFDRALRKDEDIETVVDYLLNNPIRAGLVENLAAYSYWNITDWEGSLLNLNYR